MRAKSRCTVLARKRCVDEMQFDRITAGKALLRRGAKTMGISLGAKPYTYSVLPMPQLPTTNAPKLAAGNHS
jgi:hypothetical protein